MRAVGALTLMATLIGCTSISATPQPAVSPAASLAAPSAAASAAPSLVPPSFDLSSISPTAEPTTSEPSVAPTDTPKATKTPRPATANLIITAFALDDDFILAENPTSYRATIKNAGTADAGPFLLSVSAANVDSGAQSPSDPQSVQGLAAGKSVDVTISVSLPKPGYWKLTATADSDNAVTESNEKDNSADYTAKALPGLPDLVWANSGVTFTPIDGQPGSFEVAIDIKNTGTDQLSQQASFIGLSWHRQDDGAEGTLDPFPLVDMALGEEQTLTSMRQLPGSGTYTVSAVIDRDHVLHELRTDNNEKDVTVTVP